MTEDKAQTAPQKPDETKFKAALEEANKRIEKLRAKSVRMRVPGASRSPIDGDFGFHPDAVRAKITSSPSGKSGNEKRDELRNRLTELRKQQADIKKSKQATLEHMSTINASVQRKVADMRAAQAKLPFKNVDEIDRRIADLERQVESGQLKLIDEKKMVSEISSLKKSRKLVEGFQGQQGEINAEKAKADELKRSIDDTQSKALAKEYDEIKAELDGMQKNYQSSRDERQKLFDEQNALKAQIDEQYNQIRKLREENREAHNAYWEHQKAVRERRQQAQRERQEQYEREKLEALARKEREAAEVPAYEQEILTCDNLINYLQSLNKDGASAAETNAAQATSGPSSNVREPDTQSHVQGTMLAKKSDREEENFFFAPKKKTAAPKTKKADSGVLKFNLATLEDFTTIKVDVPTNAKDLDSTIEKIKERKQYYIQEQPKATEENKKKAEEKIAALTTKLEKTTVANGKSKKSSKAEPKEDAKFADATADKEEVPQN
ncbi:hypothetical protein BZG36_02006 [Bifiguratus adelaidae]|uniref:Nuclear segregation protein Bfr1 n=1 Tax=Bifiguratus adelaidae TaxID=1938954 RepID=A0A261Y456_9FUNG|nr:hypothetical protein BZG36_02006 [Bifiguratus adelaidae]